MLSRSILLLITILTLCLLLSVSRGDDGFELMHESPVFFDDNEETFDSPAPPEADAHLQDLYREWVESLPTPQSLPETENP